MLEEYSKLSGAEQIKLIANKPHEIILLVHISLFNVAQKIMGTLGTFIFFVALVEEHATAGGLLAFTHPCLHRQSSLSSLF